MKTRSLKIEDFEEIEPMLKEFFKFCGYDEFSKYSTEVSYKTISQIVNSQDLFGCVSYDDDGINGIMCGSVHQMFMTEEKICQELFFWSSKKGAGKMLLNALEAFAKFKGAVLINMLKVRNSPDFIEDFYEKMGYKKSEVSYDKVI